MQCLYLHGFGSGPKSEKAVFFSQKLRKLGHAVHVPDLNQPAFLDLTMSRQIDQCLKLIKTIEGNDELVIFGSSMGGLTAVLLGMQLNCVRALVLFAPGFGINQRWHVIPGQKELAAWQSTGSHDVFHHATGKPEPLKFAFVEDLNTFNCVDLRTSVPTLLFHGTKDEVIPVGESRKFFGRNAEFVDYHELKSDHDLLDVLDPMWDKTERFMASICKNEQTLAAAGHKGA